MASARYPKALADGSENFAGYPAASSLRSRPSSPSVVAQTGLRRTGSGYFGGVGCCGEFHLVCPDGPDALIDRPLSRVVMRDIRIMRTGRFTWTPSVGQLGPKSFTLRVTDAAGATVTRNFNVTVVP